MSIRTKIGITLMLAVAGFCAVQFWMQNYVVLPGFLSLEKDEALKDLHRVEAVIKNEIDQLDSLCEEWSSWDDTYEFVQSPSDEYESSNLVFSTFSNNNLNLIYICDTNGRVVWGNIFDLNTQTPVDMALFPKDGFSKSHPLFCGPEAPEPNQLMKKGILLTEKGPILIASRPILTSNDGGPSRGLFVMGRFLNDEVIQSLSLKTQVDYTFQPIPGNPGDAGITAIINRISPQHPYFIDSTDADRMKVHSLYQDIFGKASLLLTIHVPRNIAHKGYETVRMGIYSILIAGLGILLMMLLILKSTILNPLARLTRHALDVKQSGDFSKRLSIDQKDEIGILSSEFNNMLATIDKTTRALMETNAHLQKDIEMRMQVVSALQESEERFRAVVDQAADEVFLNDREGRIRMVNKIACDKLGYESHELLQMRVYDIDPDFLNRKDRSQLCDQIVKKGPIIFEGHHRQRNGSSFPVEVSLSPIQYKGEPLILSIARDITQRKQMELRLRYADKMEALKTLTAGIAHNFNNILTVIIGNAGLAKQTLSGSLPAYDSICKIEKAGLRAREIVWQLINFSHPSSENMTSLPIHQVIADALEKLESSKPDRIRVRKYIQPDCLMVFGNASHFQQVIVNLWNNSVEALSDNGGEIDIRIENISLALVSIDMNPDLKPGDYVKIVVSDNGCGIDASSLKNIFDPYFSTKDFSAGAGMGLAIVYGIVKSNGGAITIDSKPGEGTCISVFFPAAETP